MAVDVEFLNGNNVNNINNNFQRVKNALQEVVGRNGNLPNHMNADLDMNSNDILNVNDIELQRIVVDGEGFDPRQMRGWAPVFSAVEYNGTVVMKLVDYVGGQGIKPTQYINWYVGSTGYVQNINQATGFGSSGVTDGDKGDIEVSSSGAIWTAPRLPVESRAWAMANLHPTTAPQFVQTAGYASAGDGGDELYALVADEPSHEGKVQTADGSWFSITKRKVKASTFGAFPSDTVSCHTQLIAAIVYTASIGGELVLDQPGPYSVNASVMAYINTGDLTITFSPGAWLKAIDGLAQAILDLRGSNDGTVAPYRVTINAPHVDATEGTNLPGVQACTGINIQNIREGYVFDPYLYGGDSQFSDHSDSGITCLNLNHFKVQGGTIRGWGDLGLYISGWGSSGPEDDGFLYESIDVLYEKCQSAISTKRQASVTVVKGGAIKECRTGVISGTTGNVNDPGRVMNVEGVLFEKMGARAIEYNAHTKGHIRGCTIRDFGIAEDGTIPQPVAIRFMGADSCEMSDTVIELVDWTRTDHIAVNIFNETFNDVPFVAGNHIFHDNVYRGISRVSVETTNTLPSHWYNETLDDVDGTLFNGFNPLNTVEYRVVGDPKRYVRAGSRTFVEGQKPVSSASAYTVLTRNDYVAEHVNDASMTYELPAPVSGDEVTFLCQVQPLTIKFASGTQGRIAGVGTSTTGGSLTCSTVGGAVTLKAVSSNQWFAKSATGTWVAA